MLKSVQIELVKPVNQELLILLKDCRKLLEPRGTIEITSTPRLLPVPYAKLGKSGIDSETEQQALASSPIVQMLREAGFKGRVTVTRRAHLGSVRTHIIAAV
jgi:hypothetical protein